MDSSLSDKIQRKDDFKNTLNAALRLLKFRPRSEKELEERLSRKDFSADAIAFTLSHLKKYAFIDDNAFSKAWIVSRLKKPYGVNRIRLELKQKGVANDIIEKNMAAAIKDYDEEETVFSLAEKRIKKYHNNDNEALKRKIYGYLSRKGFKQRTIIQTINKLLIKP